MYVGRIVSIGKNKESNHAIMYRISSRSFPNRKVDISDNEASIVPLEGFESDLFKNRFISYNCIRMSDEYVVVANGSHTDYIFEKLQRGLSIRDSMISVLFGMDYEHDSLNTPRIVAVFNNNKKETYFGIIKEDGIWVQKILLKKGQAFYVATYEQEYFTNRYFDDAFNVSNESEACEYILSKGVFANLEKSILAVSVFENKNILSKIKSLKKA
jgi:IMP cyclohydrolase